MLFTYTFAKAVFQKIVMEDKQCSHLPKETVDIGLKNFKCGIDKKCNFMNLAEKNLS